MFGAHEFVRLDQRKDSGRSQPRIYVGLALAYDTTTSYNWRLQLADRLDVLQSASDTFLIIIIYLLHDDDADLHRAPHCQTHKICALTPSIGPMVE